MNLEEMAQKLKLEKAPLIKNLFYVDKKPNSYFLVIARQDTKLDKGTIFLHLRLLEETGHHWRQCPLCQGGTDGICAQECQGIHQSLQSCQ